MKANRAYHSIRAIIAALLAVALSYQATLLATWAAAKTPFTKSSATTPFAQAVEVITVFSTPPITRDNGNPKPAHFQFALPADAVAPFNLRVQSGSANQTNRTLSATVSLNGKVVVQLDDKLPPVDQAITLTANNTLDVTIMGKPGTSLIVAITATRARPLPALASLSPTQGGQGQTLNVTLRGTNTHWAAGLTRASFGSGLSVGGAAVDTFGPVMVTDAQTATAQLTISASAATGPHTVSVVTSASNSSAAETVTLNNAFTVIAVPAPAPVITDYNPKSGPAGTLVVLTGTGLMATTVTFQGNNNARLTALVVSSSATEVRAIVPNGTVNGPIEVANALGRVTTATAFVIAPSQDFTLTTSPSSSTAVQQTSATYMVSVTSPQSGFSQLASLSATGLPTGVSAAFDPPQVTGGASSTLTLNLTSANLATGSYPFTIRAAAMVDGNQLIRTAAATLNVMASGQTTLAGRVLSSAKEPIMGATVSLDGQSTVTDSAGAFLLSGIAAGSARPLMIDGRTASAPNRTYPVITEPANVVAGQANVVPFTFYLPPIQVQYEVPLLINQDTVATNPNVPGAQMTVPAGANLRNRDGSPVARVSLTALPPDRTPAPLPANVSMAMVFTSQPGGAIADVAMPVVYPNLMGKDPGTRLELYAFNHDTVQWYVYGYGRVSTDGRSIVPETDPRTGKPYGLRDFSWHGASAAPGGNPCRCERCACSSTANKVDLSSGVKIERAIDISVAGSRGVMQFSRVHTSDLAGQCDSCPFGRGTRHNYSIRLTGSFQAGGTGRLVMPDEITGRLFSYARTEVDGALVFTTIETSEQLGDVVRRLTDNSFEYRRANGQLLRFDSGGRLLTVAERNGNTITLTYDGAGNLIKITDAVGRSIMLDYDGQNRITRATDPIGRVWTYAYDSGSRLALVVDPTGGRMNYTYDLLSRLSSITDKRGNLIKQITYDNRGRVVMQKFAEGGFERYDYTLAGAIVAAVTITDALGRVRTLRFDARGYVNGITDALGQSTRIDRDVTTSLPLTVTGPCGCAEALNQFDERGNVTSVTDRLGATETMQYEPTFNKITRMTDKLGRTTTYTYDARGNRLSMTDALGQTTTYTYDQFGQMTSRTDPLSHTWRMDYDAQGNMTAITDPLGNKTLMEYDGIGRRTATIDPLGRRTAMTYDKLSRILTKTTPNGAVTRYAYDANGNLVSVTDALGRRWAMTYNARNRLTAKVDPLGRVWRMLYNANNEKVAEVSPSGRTTRFSYDARGQRETMSDPNGSVVQYQYDNQRKLTAIVDERGNTTTYTYDELHRQTGMRDTSGRLMTKTYDAVGNVTSTTDRLGRRTNIVYDALNRVSRVEYVDAVLTINYDAAGRVVRMDDTQSGGISWTYDEANRKLSETTEAGTISYSYNAAGERRTMTAADSPAVSYGYDMAGRLQTISQAAESFTYTYDAISRLNTLQRPNGVTTNYVYDDANRLTQLTHTPAQGGPLEDLHYSFNLDSEITAISSLSPSPPLADAKTVAEADALNRIPQAGGTAFSFDAEGKLIRRSDAQGATSYTWDARGRLTKVILPDGQAISYGYDALGRRTSRVAAGITTSFLYDRDDVVIDVGSDGKRVAYLNGQTVDEKLRQTSAATGSLYYHQDRLGSTIALSSSSGNVVERLQYDPFGVGNANATTRYGFVGREHDSATGLIYFRSRWYDPQQGRFLREDPYGIKGGLNLYAYVKNNPIYYRDPYGLAANLYPRPMLPEDPGNCVIIGSVIGGVIGGTLGGVVGVVSIVGGPLIIIVEPASASYGAGLGVLAGGAIGGLLCSRRCDLTDTGEQEIPWPKADIDKIEDDKKKCEAEYDICILNALGDVDEGVICLKEFEACLARAGIV